MTPIISLGSVPRHSRIGGLASSEDFDPTQIKIRMDDRFIYSVSGRPYRRWKPRDEAHAKERRLPFIKKQKSTTGLYNYYFGYRENRLERLPSPDDPLFDYVYLSMLAKLEGNPLPPLPVTEEPPSKKCAACGRRVLLEMFEKDEEYADGLKTRCTPCRTSLTDKSYMTDRVVLGEFADKIRARVSVEADGCWVWLGPKDAKGYGLSTLRKHRNYTHRIMYAAAKGPIPEGFQIDHLCRNPPCCNPDHLDAVTPRENTLRGLSPMLARLRRERSTHCRYGHEYTPENSTYDGKGYRSCRECRRKRNEEWGELRRKRAALRAKALGDSEV